MIWSSTPDGKITYVSSEWTDLTGQRVADALEHGWLKMLHPDDVGVTIEAFRQACTLAATFTIRYRLRHPDGTYIPVVVGASPSISPVDGAFLGYLGSLAKCDMADLGPSSNQIGILKPQKPAAFPTLTSAVDIVADYLLLAKSTAQMAGEERLVPSLDFAISEVMRRLGYEMETRPRRN
jgi:PAS domain S-box-containing protein